MHVMTNGGRRGGLVPGHIALIAALVFILYGGAQEPARNEFLETVVGDCTKVLGLQRP